MFLPCVLRVWYLGGCVQGYGKDSSRVRVPGGAAAQPAGTAARVQHDRQTARSAGERHRQSRGCGGRQGGRGGQVRNIKTKNGR